LNFRLLLNGNSQLAIFALEFLDMLPEHEVGAS
jgi:hypothetical protein